MAAHPPRRKRCKLTTVVMCFRPVHADGALAPLEGEPGTGSYARVHSGWKGF